MILADEIIEIPCGICGAKHQRKNTQDYAYFSGVLYCTKHPGIIEWQKNLLDLMFPDEDECDT